MDANLLCIFRFENALVWTGPKTADLHLKLLIVTDNRMVSAAMPMGRKAVAKMNNLFHTSNRKAFHCQGKSFCYNVKETLALQFTCIFNFKTN